MNKTSFPECIYFGELESEKYGNLPVYFPAHQGGFCLVYHGDDSKRSNRLIENVALCLLQDSPASLLKVRIFDFALRPNFPYLNQLRKNELSQVSLNEESVINVFNELENLIQYRFHTLFNSNETHINHYNSRSPRPEPFYLLIVNTQYFPTGSLSLQRLENFMKSAYDAGIYIIALHNDLISQDDENVKKTLDCFLSFLPEVKLAKNFKELHTEESTFPSNKFNSVDFEFIPADINQSKVIADLESILNGKSSYVDEDFIKIKFGIQPDGSEAYFSLGKASLNYHALLLGKTGTGKSTLMNNIIVSIAKQYDASQIRLYLMDYKQGVEFNRFVDHPNVEKIFLKSNDIQAGINLLEQLKVKIEQRYELFKAKGMQEIEEFNQTNPDYQVPHIILMVDEFHKLLQGDFRHNDYVNTLLEDVAKLGRASGIHLFLSTQSLKDVNLKASVKDQIGLRMTYAVANDMALGFDIFDSKHIDVILDLQKFELFTQVDNRTGLRVFVDKPYEVDSTIKQIRMSRPPHLQVKAEIIESSSSHNEEDANDLLKQSKSKTSMSSDHEVVDKQQLTVNPNVERFNSLDILIKQAEKKLKSTESGDEDDEFTPDWL